MDKKQADSLKTEMEPRCRKLAELLDYYPTKTDFYFPPMIDDFHVEQAVNWVMDLSDHTRYGCRATYIPGQEEPVLTGLMRQWAFHLGASRRKDRDYIYAAIATWEIDQNNFYLAAMKRHLKNIIMLQDPDEDGGIPTAAQDVAEAFNQMRPALMAFAKAQRAYRLADIKYEGEHD